jgi:uncharacterized membrane protein (UPF0127 family)
MKNLIYPLFLTLFIACGSNNSSNNSSKPSTEEAPTTQTPETKDPLKYVELISPDKQTIRSSIASTSAEQTKGLQGVRDSQFAEDEGKLFFYLKESARTFWMPNTYFNLDLIYLDQNMKITDIVWNLLHYTGSVDSQIPRAPTITSRHVLEMKAGSPISSTLKIGDSLKWKSPLTLQQTELKIRQQ